MKRTILRFAILPIFFLVGAVRPSAAPAQQPTASAAPAKASSDKIWAELTDGNKRFIAGRPRARDLVATRNRLTTGQQPKVVVLACSDSRVAPELIFDHNLGEVFVVRTAGNIADAIGIGSIEYAVEHLGSTVLVVLGHTKCGAVSAACARQKMPTPGLQAIVDKIEPAVERAAKSASGDALVEAAIKENVYQSAHDVVADSAELQHFIHDGKLTVIEAEYDITSGEVVRLDSASQ
jgi:carbonic anhydrase